jgi:hypothetical protein
MSGEASRARLHALLAEACELEHALCCSYLFAAFSMRRDLSEGLDWRRQQTARKWASQIYHVAAQEMLHLAQAWNLLTATGGAVYYGRPNFPQPARNFPLNVALTLRRFDAPTLDRFMIYENPGDAVLTEATKATGVLWPLEEEYEYDHVGELYGEIGRIIDVADPATLFVENSAAQRGQNLVDFHDIVRVTDRASAAAAISGIVLQGEGNRSNRKDSHFGVFSAIRDEVDRDGFDYALPAGDNPLVAVTSGESTLAAGRLEEAGIRITTLTDRVAVHAVDLFNDSYQLMLQALAFLFVSRTTEAAKLKAVSTCAIEIMITILKPLGEAICRLPSGQSGLNAGPSFELRRHVALPGDPGPAVAVLAERLAQLFRRGELLLGEDDIAPGPRHQIAGAVANLGRIHRELVSKAGP